jgi:hypothetical protein
LCDVPQTRISSYEWRESSWRSESAREELVRTAEELCLGRIYVDITAAAVVGEDTDLLASDVASLVRLADGRGIEIGVVAGDPW